VYDVNYRRGRWTDYRRTADPSRGELFVSAEMETISSEDSNSARRFDQAGCATSRDPSSLPSSLPLQLPSADGRKQRRSSCRPTFVTAGADDGGGDDCALQGDPGGNGGDEAGEKNRLSGDVPGRRRHSVW